MESETVQISPINESPSQRPQVGDETLSNAQKIALFRRLFRGRDDVFPARWENAKSGRSGYSPVCANEWREGLCGKPRIKCSVCPHQAFVPVSDEMIGRHLRGLKAATAFSSMARFRPILTSGISLPRSLPSRDRRSNVWSSRRAPPEKSWVSEFPLLTMMKSLG
jgi:hypothetical protein